MFSIEKNEYNQLKYSSNNLIFELIISNIKIGIVLLD
jgi:hypothetical protein